MYSSSPVLSALFFSTRPAHCDFLLATTRLPAFLIVHFSHQLVLSHILSVGGIVSVRL